MKISTTISALLLTGLIAKADAGSLISASNAVTERGLHHAVNENVRVIDKNGRQQSITNRYTTLAAGMHRVVNGELVSADPVIELHPDGAIADKTQHKVKFLANINNWEGAIDLETPDGQRFLSRPLGISYHCPVTGQSVLIAELKDSVGTLFPPNKIIYESAFTDFKADLEYNNLLSGLQQNLIFRESPPEPASFGLNNDTTYIEFLTEFFAAPEPVKKTQVRNGIEDDRQLRFGSMTIGVGKSFMIGAEGRSYSVQKQWTQLNGRQFLIERLEYGRIAPLLNTLPLPAQAGVKQKDFRRIASKSRLLPKREIAKNSRPKTIQIARGPANQAGFLIDYSIVSTSTDFTFEGDTTYYVTNAVNLDGTTVFDAGAVLKYTNGGQLQISGPAVFKGTEYRPTIFTGKDDNRVGEPIPGTTGNPVGNLYGGVYLLLINSTSNDVAHIRMSYANMGIEFDNAENGNSLRHSQFIGCNKGLSHVAAVSHLKNVLMFDVRTNFLGAESALHAEHLTINASQQLCYTEPGYTFPIRFTNSLLVAVTNIGSSDYNVTNSNFFLFNDDPGVFKTVGAASHYLPDNSGFRNIGTTTISSDLLADLKSRTTYAPAVIEPSEPFTNSINLKPTVLRDTDIPDLGYHYDTLDYAIGSMLLSNATINVSAGTAIASFATGTNEYGISTEQSSKLIVEGSPTNLVRLVRYNTVQEQSNTNWSKLQESLISTTSETVSPVPEISFRFADFSCLDRRIDLFRGAGLNSLPVPMFGCQVRGGTVVSSKPTLNITNCLFQGATLELRSGSHNVYNCSFQGGLLYLRGGSQTSTIKDNLFDHTAVLQTASPTNDFNAYVSGQDRIIPNGANDLILTSTTYEEGDLGNYYYPAASALINAGSRHATNAALYHFTTLTNNTKEAGTQVDIGFHYVAVSNGSPVDTDGEGLADYIEDANGNGSWDTGETKWLTAGAGDPKDTDGDGVDDFVEWLQGRTGTVNGTTSGATLNLNLYTPTK